MNENPLDPNLEAYAAIEAELLAIDKRLDALESEEVLSSESVDEYVASLERNRSSNYADFLSSKQLIAINETYNDLLNADVRCSQEDYALAAISGFFGGIIDALFASSPIDPKKPLEKIGPLQKFSSEVIDNFVKVCARLSGQKPTVGKESSIASAIGFLERGFPVVYDQTNSSQVGNAVRHLTTMNHHAKSLSHYPDILGLLSSIANQLTGTSTFVNESGRIVIVRGNGGVSELKGENIIERLFYGTFNWLGHCMSDVAGSSGSRGKGNIGMGLPIPLTEFFQFCNFGRFPNEKGQWQTLATVFTQVYEQGYDTRHGMTMSIPVVMTDLLVRLFYALNRIYRDGVDIKEAIKPTDSRPLNRLLTVAQGSLCLVDLGHASATSLTYANWVSFFCKLNLIAWVRFGSLGIKELSNYTRHELKNMEQIQDRIDADWDDLLSRSESLLTD